MHQLISKYGCGLSKYAFKSSADLAYNSELLAYVTFWVPKSGLSDYK